METRSESESGHHSTTNAGPVIVYVDSNFQAIQEYYARLMEPLSPRISFHDFLEWRVRWNDFVTLSGLSKFSRRQQIACLRLFLTSEMRVTIKSLGVEGETDLSTDEVLDRIQAKLDSQRFILIERLEFLNCIQLPHETFDEFYVRLYKLAEAANLCKDRRCAELSIIAIIYRSIKKTDLRMEILEIKPFPTLEQVCAICRRDEVISEAMPYITRRNPQITEEGSKQVRRRGKVDNKSTTSIQTSKPCTNCGMVHYRAQPHNQTCPAKGKVCTVCGKLNHFASVCRSKSRR